MGITSITAARILEGQMERGYGEDHVLSWEKFPWSAQSKTYNVNSQSADSGACATAFLCGVKTNQGEHKYNCSLGRAGQLRLLSDGDDGTIFFVGGGGGGGLGSGVGGIEIFYSRIFLGRKVWQVFFQVA